MSTTDQLRALPASDLFGWFWAATHKEWNLRQKNNAPSRATVFPNGVWHTWDHNGVGGENSSAATVDAAKSEAFEAAKRQVFLNPPNALHQATAACPRLPKNNSCRVK